MMKLMKYLLMVVLLTTAEAFAAVPVISVPTVASCTDNTCTVTWTTDIGSDTMVYFGAADTYGQDQGTSNTSGSGVTSHSQTITGLRPRNSYVFGIRSCPVSGGVPDRTQCAFFIDVTGVTLTANPPANAQMDFYLDFWGPKHVVKGHEIYVAMQIGKLQGADDTVNFVFSGLPPNSTLSTPVLPSGYSFNAGTSTLQTFESTSLSWSQFEIATASSTPAGTYVIQLVGTSVTVPIMTHTYSWTITVDAVPSFTFGVPSSYPAIPCLNASSKDTDGSSSCLANWETNMTTDGALACMTQPIAGRFQDNSHGCNIGSERCSWYYDGERVFYQIAEYTHDLTTWDACAKVSRTLYRDYYVECGFNSVCPTNNPDGNWSALSAAGGTQGWRVFTDGLYMDWLRNGDPVSKTAIHDLQQSSVFSQSGGNIGVLDPQLISEDNVREAQYKIPLNRYDLKFGNSSAATLNRSVAYALGHLSMYSVSGNAKWQQPFMTALTMQALIEYYEDGHQDDERIPTAIKTMCDWLWANAWVANPGVFYYNSYFASALGSNGDLIDPVSTNADLNLLVAPAFAWLFKMTGNATYQTEGDIIFSKGVQNAAVGFNGKIFSQNYRWSFSYVKWRSAPKQTNVGGSMVLGAGTAVR